MLWGLMGVFSNTLSKIGFSSMEGTAIRLISCALIFIIINFKKLKINPKDIWQFVLIGVFSIFAMSFTYFESIKCSSLTVASVLLYTAPIMVTLMSYIFYHEQMTLKKLLCLIGSVLGVVLISGVDKTVNITSRGLVYGILSGFSYALYSILGKMILKKYEPITVASYAFIFAALCSLFTVDFGYIANVVTRSENIIKTLSVMVGCGIVTAAIPYTLYTLGLKNTPAGKASVLACVEPLTATLFGVTIYGDKLGIVSVTGIVLIILSVGVLSYKNS